MKSLMSSRWRSPLLLALLSGLALFAGINRYALIGPDEPRYTAVARGMIERGDFITPVLGGHPWFEKPALLYWLIGASYKLLGVSEWSSRVSSGLAGLATVLLVYAIGRKVRSVETGVLAGGMLLCSPLFFAFARGATFDMLLTACVTAALACFLAAESSTGSHARLWFVLCAACVALAMLTKGLVGVVLVGGVIAAYVIVTGRMRAVFGYPLVLASIVFLLVCSVWYGPVIAIHGKVFLREFFLQHHFERFTTNRYHHPGPIYYYIGVATVGIFPWTPLLLLPLFRLRDWFRFRWRDGNSNTTILLAAWVLFPLVFFTFSVSKLPGYYLPAFPALCLLIALETTEALESSWQKLLAGCMWASIALLLGLALWFAIETRIALPPAGRATMVGAFGLVAIGAVVLLLIRRWHELILWLVCSLSICIALTSNTLAPWMTQSLSYRDLAEVVIKKAIPGEPVIFFGDAPRTVHSISFYADRGLFYDEQRGGSGRKELRELLSASQPSALVIVSESNLDLLTSSNRFHTEELGRQNEMILLRVRLDFDGADH